MKEMIAMPTTTKDEPTLEMLREVVDNASVSPT
jgi:hypothetical protein